ncbi:Beta-phenylalanine transaminase [Colletotrichum truncatum]|uniref:Beta-phenylalanine transaminase n=1 Tax=Colletotrichum truncatum TaxID=5467 RepID=A0ACC3ZFN0_COLTU|nr:Beta-phenylalanine transaminase [Colletotrichum truncatum]KAF6801840.1 Beta-phenylalanine transaminase [Colletotrichum truncatum]
MPPSIAVIQNADQVEPSVHDDAGVYLDFIGTSETSDHPLAVGVWDIYDFEEPTPSGIAETTECKYIVRGEAVVKNEWTGETHDLKPGSLLWIPAGAKMSLVRSNNCRAIYAEVRQVSNTTDTNDGRAVTLQSHLDRLIGAFVARNPLSKKAIERARVGIPSGTTRSVSVLDSDPFPLVVKSGAGATLTTVDGETLIEFQSDFTAGLFGHSSPELRDSIIAAAENGFSLGAVTELESELSEAIRRRFPSIEKVRFCNSGTEANMYAIGAALAYTGKRKVLVFDHGYHGGTLSFGDGPNPLNIPHDFVVGTYDSIEKTRTVLSGDIGVILVEPMQSAGGMRAASREFLAFLRSTADTLGAVLIFDEVVTSRLDYHGMQGQLGVKPDMTTLGKYLGGGLPFGAFGGTTAVMAQFDGGSGNAAKLSHSGTFNNNVFTMSAAVAAAKLVTAPAIDRINRLGDRIREGVAAAVKACDKPVGIIPLGVGSCVGLYFTGSEGDTLREIMFFEMLQQGLWVGRRGFLALNFAHTEEDVDMFLRVFVKFLDLYI